MQTDNANPWLGATDGTGLIAHDPWLEPHADALRHRYNHYRYMLSQFDESGGLMGQVSQGHHFFGFTRGELYGKPGVWYREWAPEALQLRLVGDFNGWDRHACPMVREGFGVWSIFLPDEDYGSRLVHGSRVKVHVIAENSSMDRIPAYIRRVVQEENNPNFTGIYWMPPEEYVWQHQPPKVERGLRVYEAHVGMALEDGRVGSFNEFREHILPRIAATGYNAVQLMAIMEHPYYGSFGYHVSNFYAVSSRFGTPDELKALIDEAHRVGLVVLLDIIHSHSVKNTHEGLNMFDGTEYQYFHAGGRGQHVAWDSLLFDYRKWEVCRFLLSNIRFWLEEYNFDGFRFDGITSMMYLDHGLGKDFNSYADYFDGNVDHDAVAYVQMANQLAHMVKPDCITVAEDVSGMVGLGRPVDEGGLGFDYRLAMGVPDYWIKLLKEKSDDQWHMEELYHTLMNRRGNENHIGYAESHDQALVGDKTLAFWLMDQEMYWHMDRNSTSLVIDRGVALHKMIRLVTFALAGEGYLNFIGNEFGHPEWVDFPREGNGYSYHHARRQWSLVDQDHLRYIDLLRFDGCMQALDQQFDLLRDPFIEKLWTHEDWKLLIFRRGPLVFAFNFHPTQSQSDRRIPVPDATDYRIVLNSDDGQFGGHARVLEHTTYPHQSVGMEGRGQSIQMYLPARTVQVLAPVNRWVGL